MDSLSDDEKLEEIKQDKLEKLIEEKINEKTKEKDTKIEKLEKEVEKLKTSSNAIDNSSTNKTSKGISRRQFLKKASLGSIGLGALLSPVSADFFIKDDSFSVQTSSDGGSTLSEGLFVDQNQNVNVPNGNLTENGNRVATRNWTNNNHAVDSSAHHEKPTSTQSSTGYTETTFSYSYSDNYDWTVESSNFTDFSDPVGWIEFDVSAPDDPGEGARLRFYDEYGNYTEYPDNRWVDGNEKISGLFIGYDHATLVLRGSTGTNNTSVSATVTFANNYKLEHSHQI